MLTFVRKHKYFFLQRVIISEILSKFALIRPMDMKKLILCLMVAVLVGCATSEEKAARDAERAREVAAALADRHYTIGVTRMHPQRGRSVNVSYGYELKVKGDTLVSYLPYFGRAYSVPYGGGKGLNFTSHIDGYRETRVKKGLTRVELVTTNDEDTYYYMIEVFDNGWASISVQMRQREHIRYDGEMKEPE